MHCGACVVVLLAPNRCFQASALCVLLTFDIIIIISVRSFLVLGFALAGLSSGFRSLIWEFDAVSSEREREGGRDT